MINVLIVVGCMENAFIKLYGTVTYLKICSQIPNTCRTNKYNVHSYVKSNLARI